MEDSYTSHCATPAWCPMCIEGIPKNSQDILADLAHPQQDGTFEHSIGFEPHIWFTKPALYQLSYRVHCARFLLTFVERSFSIWRPDRAIALFRWKDFTKNHVERVGFEPTTSSSSGKHSTTELPFQIYRIPCEEVTRIAPLATRPIKIFAL